MATHSDSADLGFALQGNSIVFRAKGMSQRRYIILSRYSRLQARHWPGMARRSAATSSCLATLTLAGSTGLPCRCLWVCARRRA